MTDEQSNQNLPFSQDCKMVLRPLERMKIFTNSL